MIGAAVVTGESSSRSCGSVLQDVTSNGRNKVLVGGLCSCAVIQAYLCVQWLS